MELIAEKCRTAIAISLIPDLWTNRQMWDFMGLGAQLSFKNGDRRLVILGMKRMTQKHNAEGIKDVIEEIVNEYQFNKQKIRGKYIHLNTFWVKLG